MAISSGIADVSGFRNVSDGMLNERSSLWLRFAFISLSLGRQRPLSGDLPAITICDWRALLKRCLHLIDRARQASTMRQQLFDRSTASQFSHESAPIESAQHRID